MMNQKWIGFGKGTKNKKGEYIEMYFDPDDICQGNVLIKPAEDLILKLLGFLIMSRPLQSQKLI